MSGLQDINYRIPDQWSSAWFARFIRDVLANADVRNAIPGTGITISGTPDVPATISSGIDVQQLIDQPYILAVPSTPAGFLTHERVLAADPEGIITITDGGPNSDLTLSIVAIPYSKLPIQPALSILGNAFSTTDDPSPIEGTVEFAIPHIEDIGAGVLEIVFSTVDHEYISDFAEAAQDFVGNIFVDTATIDFTYNDGTPSITADVINDSITDTKLRNSAALSVIGRSANSTGDPADIVASADGDVLRRSGTSIGFGSIVLAASNLANPTASIGLAAVNGIAITAMRSDGAPALSQAIAPTWTDQHIFSFNAQSASGEGAVAIKSAIPIQSYYATGAAADQKIWLTYCTNTTFIAATLNDANTVSRNWISAGRTGAAITVVTVGNATDLPPVHFQGTQIGFIDGSVGTPVLSFINDTDTGRRRSGANAVRDVAGGADATGFDDNSTAGNTRFLIYDVDNATLERVTVGAADSGGTGFKLLRIPN